ncbi:zinc ABC transporter substrate-binding protein [Virgibacillus halophilus]|uniref:Zinc ABC transporter substrate-binding protein n=1 Tax=Tigheibacillus halophilus TaxID=361280 RepID=A0ABU5C1L6_9BACI|nr:zinc ABC transporter substrate-binding protein [Virgibacillus halophilus]
MQANLKLKGMVITLFVFITIIATGCGSDTTKSHKAKLPLKIYTTIAPLADFTSMIGGKDVEVESILPPGADAHTFEPTSKEVVHIAKADAFIYNGLGMESYAEKISDSLEHENVAVVEASKHVKVMKEKEHDHDADGHNHGDMDPHIWLDPVRAITMADNIKHALIKIHPESEKNI